MIGLSLALLLQASLLAAGNDNYATAHQRTTQTGQPLVVLVGAEWCPGCRQMKENVIPQAKHRGLFKNVAFALVNPDEEPQLAGQLMRGRSIPQLIMYHKTADGWKRRRLIGAQSLEQIASFLVVDKTETAGQRPSTVTPTNATVSR